MSESQSLFPWWIPLFCVGVWLLVGATLAHVSGWPDLAARYPGGDRPSGRVLRGQVISIGVVSEKNVTCLVPTETGLYIYASFLFRFMHPPILVPWAEMSYESPRRFLWMKWHKLRLGGGLMTMSVKDEGFRALQIFLPSVPGTSAE